ncbi:MAG TPA: hypothetical protein VIK55_05915 [Paludibacter sp.]
MKSEMVKNKHLLATLLWLLSFTFMQANNRSDIYHAYITNDRTKWKKTIDRMEKETPKTNDFVLELINYQYGYIGWCLGTDRKNEAVKYLNLAEKNIDQLASTSYKLSYVNAYKAAFYGFRMNLALYKAPVLGPKRISCCKTAMQLDKTNPFGFLQFGNTLYYRPKVLGGSKNEGLSYYLKAERLMESLPAYNTGDWNYLNLLAIISLAYEETGQREMAGKYYQKAIRVEPKFVEIINELFPALKKNGAH